MTSSPVENNAGVKNAEHMEQLFNPQLPDGGHPDIHLCIFPHLPEFLVIDSRTDNPQVLVMHTDDVFNEDFYRTIESDFSGALRSTKESLFSHLINLPILIDETVRDIAMTFILQKLGVMIDSEDDIPSVVVYVVSGGALATHTGNILDGIHDLIHSSFSGAESDCWANTIADLVQRETEILERLSEQQVEEAIKGDSPDYFTLWESRN
jgi:hypothetical protein